MSAGRERPALARSVISSAKRGNLAELLRVRAGDHNGYDAFFDRDGNPDVHLLMKLDSAARPACIHARVLQENSRRQRYQKVGVRDATPCVFSFSATSFSRASTNPPASISRTTKKCGTLVQLCVVRSAIRRAIELIVSGAAGARAFAGRSPAMPLKRQNVVGEDLSFVSGSAHAGQIDACVRAGELRRRAWGRILISRSRPPRPVEVSRRAKRSRQSFGPRVLRRLRAPSRRRECRSQAIRSQRRPCRFRYPAAARPCETDSPSFFRHANSLPVSWAISSAGITML